MLDQSGTICWLSGPLKLMPEVPDRPAGVQQKSAAVDYSACVVEVPQGAACENNSLERLPIRKISAKPVQWREFEKSGGREWETLYNPE